QAREAREASERASRSAPRSYGGDPRGIAAEMAASKYGWGAGEVDCLDSLWAKESGWDPHAENPSSGAYGIPQALPGSKMSEYGSDWQDNPGTQIEWGLAYIDGRYGSPCSAWSTAQSQGWY
ncbi:MAG: lytic transglycosylase domain-containing protein, partial [Actinomycetes bacterium]